MQHPAKWRETIDPFSLPYHDFRLTEILGYPHAGNDVFHAKGIYNGQALCVFIKAARQKDAAIEREVSVLSQLDAPRFPKLIDFGLEGTPFSVTAELPGERLSTIVGENDALRSLEYMEEYGATLAELHQWSLRTEAVRDRSFFHPPTEELLDASGLGRLKAFFAKPPQTIVRCFCHGDFHYANILWHRHHVSGILDFELAGVGNRDFDIAWALFRRPGQMFLKTQEEQEAFLRGYTRIATCDRDAVKYYMAQCYVYFLQFSADDGEYCAYVRSWMKTLLEEAL